MIQLSNLMTHFNFTQKQILMTIYSEKKAQPMNFILQAWIHKCKFLHLNTFSLEGRFLILWLKNQPMEYRILAYFCSRECEHTIGPQRGTMFINLVKCKIHPRTNPEKEKRYSSTIFSPWHWLRVDCQCHILTALCSRTRTDTCCTGGWVGSVGSRPVKDLASTKIWSLDCLAHNKLLYWPF